MSKSIESVIARLRQIPGKVDIAVTRTMQSQDWRTEMAGIAARTLERNKIFVPGMLGAVMSLVHHESTTGMMRFWLHSHQSASVNAGHSTPESLIDFVRNISDEDLRKWVVLFKDKKEPRDPKDESGNWDIDAITRQVSFAKYEKPEKFTQHPGKEGSLITEVARMTPSGATAMATDLTIPGEVMVEILAEWKAHVRERLPKRVAAAIRKELGSDSSDPF